MCEEYSFQDIQEENVLNHRIAKHSKYSCNKCEFQSRSEINLNEHKSHAHGENKALYQCDVCDFADNTEENVLNHKIAKHSGHCCEMCNYETDSLTKLEVHIKNTHKQTKFTCNICTSVFSTHIKLKEHKDSMHKPNTFPCDYCGNKSETIENLDKHIETFHRIRRKLISKVKLISLMTKESQ